MQTQLRGCELMLGVCGEAQLMVSMVSMVSYTGYVPTREETVWQLFL
jgi:hypothetical protein